jgi:hypothetical protein
MPLRRGIVGRAAAYLLTALAAAAVLAFTADAGYVAVVLTADGKCSDLGYCIITSSAACNTAASTLGLPGGA